MWEAFKDFLFWIIQSFYSMVGDWGMAIIIVTIIFRALLTPLIYRQTKSTYQTQKMQPYMQQIKERFPDDKARQNEEMQKLYAETKFNPLAGCIPMLLQMPIFIALFQVLRSIQDYVGVSGKLCFYGLVQDITVTPGDAFTYGFATFYPYLILLLVFGGTTFIPTLLQQKGQTGSQVTQTRIMVAVMSGMMLWIGWSSPAGVLLFWGTSSVIAIIQQQVSMKRIKKLDEEAASKQTYDLPSEIRVDRKVQKKRQSKKR